jgi:hypothetical protein
MAGLWGVAAAVRLTLLDGPLFGDESAHYAVARGWGDDPSNVYPEYGLNEALWWQRPLFSLLLAPGAAVGLLAYRVEHALLAALLPLAVASVVRKAGARPLLAAGAGLAVALHPTFVLWGARAFPDSIMATLALAGLRAHQSGRPLATAALFAAAAWTKEAALPLAAGLLAWATWTARRRGEAVLWPLRLDRASTGLLGAVLLGALPTAYTAVVLDSPLPGWSGAPFAATGAAGLVVTAWLLVPVVAGLAWPRSRPYSLAALAFAAAALAHAALGHGLAAWSVVAPAALTVVGAAIALDEAGRHASGAVRASGRAATAALAVALLVLAAVPNTVLAKEVAAPAGRPPASLGQLSGELHGDALADAVAAIRDDQWDVVFLVDVGWYHVDHPFAQRAGAVGWSYTGVSIPLDEWTRAVEGSSVTVLATTDRPLNVALRSTYADCVQANPGGFLVIDGPLCPGRGAQLRQALGA